MADPRDLQHRLGTFVSELKRRRVYRVMIMYAVVAFVIWQVAEIAFPALRLPDWTLTLVVVLTLLGFPVALVLAWAFDLSSEGIRRTPQREPEVRTEEPSGALAGGRSRPALYLIVAALLLAGVGAYIFTRPSADDPLPAIDSIAVLPLDPLSRGGEQYFADGMTEALISRLSRIGNLKVISRTSVMQYRNAQASAPQIARELGVDGLIEGSVLHDEDRVRITVQLIDARTDVHLWSRSYERSLEDVLALQAEVAEAIATEIQGELTGTEQQQLGNRGTVDPESYQHYLRGRHHWAQHTEERWRSAIEHFERAIAADSTYAPAYAGLADALNSLAFFGHVRAADAYIRARGAVERALELDPSLSDAHTILARIRYVHDWNWEGAERAFRHAIALNANDAAAHHGYAVFLARVGRFGEAHAALDRAVELDPLAPRLNNNRAWIPFLANDYDRAIREYLRARELHPQFAMTWRELAWAYAEVGESEEAVRAAERAVELSDDDFTLASLGYVLGRSGNEWRGREVLGELNERAAARYVSPTNLALVQLGLGETEVALDRIEEALDDRSAFLANLGVHPFFDPVRSGPRFERILERMNFPGRVR